MSKSKADIQNFTESLLNDGHLLEIKMSGYSMFPTLKGGEYAQILKCTPDKVKPGEIVVFRCADKLIAHRIHKITTKNSGIEFLAKGDNNSFFDKPFTDKELVGKVISKKKEQNGEKVKINRHTFIYRFIVAFPAFSTQLNHIFQRISEMPRRMCNKTKRTVDSYKFIAKGSEKLVIINSVLSVLQGILPFLLILCIKWIVDFLTGETSVSTSNTVDFFILIIISAVVFFSNGLVNELRSLWGERLSQSVIKHMYASVQNKHLSLQISNLENPAELDKIHRAVQESTFRPVKLINDGLQLLRSAASAVFLVVLFISIKWYIALILILSVIPGILVRLKFARKQQQLKKSQSTTEREMYYFNRVLTALPFAKELKLFHFSDFFRKNFQSRQEKLHSERINIRRSEILQNIGSHLFTVVLIFVTLAWLSYLKINGTINLGAVVLFLFTFQRGFTVLSDLLKSVTQILEDSSYLDEIMDFFAIPCIEPFAEIRMTLNEGIRIENLSFSYKNSARMALKNINLEIKAGKTVAIVGHNGSGKSTLIKLICGFYEPTEGQVFFDNISTIQLGQKAISDNMAAVFQDFALYNVSAAQNIALGRLSDKMDYCKIVDAAKDAGIDDVLQNLPKGYDTLLGNSFYGGEELSMGQWQKLAIARAFYRNADFIVMDEPSSALDVHAEQQIMKSVGKMTENKTAIIISHRLSSVKWVDEIIVFREGEIVEQGNHNDLVSKKGYYYELYQASKNDIID